MFRRTTIKGCMVILALLVVAVLVAVWWLGRPPLQPADRVALGIVAFTGEGDLQVERLRSEETVGGDRVQYRAKLDDGSEAVFDVDEEKQVVGFLRLGQRTSTVRLSLVEAADAARVFARQHYTSPALLDTDPSSAELVDSMDGMRFYRFIWSGRDPQSGALLPQQVCVEVNAESGQVDSYHALDQAVTVSTRPRVDLQAAEQTALGIVPTGKPLPAVQRHQLAVTTVPLLDPDGRQALVWLFTLAWEPDESGYTPMLDVLVDAQSGEVLSVEPY